MAPFKIQVVGTTANKIGEVAGSNPVPATDNPVSKETGSFVSPYRSRLADKH